MGTRTVGSGTLLLIPAARKAREMLSTAAGLLAAAATGVTAGTFVGSLGGAVLVMILAAAATWAVLGAVGAAAQPTVARVFDRRMANATRENTVPALWATLHTRRTLRSLRCPRPAEVLKAGVGGVLAHASKRFSEVADARLLDILEKRARHLGMEGPELQRAHTRAAIARTMAWCEDNLPSGYEDYQLSRYLNVVGDRAWLEDSAISPRTLDQDILPTLGLDEERLRNICQILEAAIYTADRKNIRKDREGLRTVRTQAARLSRAAHKLRYEELSALRALVNQRRLHLDRLGTTAERYAGLPEAARTVVTTLADRWEGDADGLLEVATTL